LSRKDRELLEAVRSWRPSKELHPIAIAAYEVYARNGNSLPPSAVQALRSVLDECGDDLQSLAGAMEGLVRFMLHLGEELGDEENSERVAKLLGEHAGRFEPLWRRVAAALSNEGEDVQAMFFSPLSSDDAAKKSTPALGDRARPPHWVPEDQE
jgi:hypothetical protein